MTLAAESAPAQQLSGRDNDNDDTAINRALSPLASTSTSTPTTTLSPASTSFLPVVERVCTPLSLFLDSAPNSSSGKLLLLLLSSDAIESAATVRQRYLNMSPTAARPVEYSYSGRAAAGTEDIAASASVRLSASSSAPCVAQDGREGPKIIATATNNRPHLSFPEDPPLRTGSVQPSTTLAHPKPILHLATDSKSISIKPDLTTRSASALSNIARLEATAERLSMTSSIDDAIRELHGELKRSDSRRSSNLAASIRAASADEYSTSAAARLRRHPSTSSSAVARHRGYSPAAYVMSPSHSLTGRMRSGSKTSTGGPDYDVNSILSRHGPGKSSVRSVRSAKPSLAEISESEPISLTQDVLDEVDASPVEQVHNDDNTRRILEQDAVTMPNTSDLHQMMEGSFTHRSGPDLTLANPDEQPYQESEEERPPTSNSNTTSQQAQDAFIDFDGVHCEAHDGQHTPPQMEPVMQPEMHPEVSSPKPSLNDLEMVKPQSYYDQRTGQQMLYYPARVPAMLNLPPKLSNKPKAAQRNQRRSQILSVMMDGKGSPDKRQSVIPDLEKSWLPDPLSGHRNSFAALSTADQLQEAEVAPAQPVQPEEPTPQPETETESTPEALRRPQRLSKMDIDKRKSKASPLDNVPAHLRASVFFDLPSDIPEIEIKDGSAMATLDSILDASANAPVSAFTDHVYAGKLGPEIYGREKKHKSMASVPALSLAGDSPAKKRSSLMLLNKRSSSYNSEEKSGTNSTPSAMNTEHENHTSTHDTEIDNVMSVATTEQKDAEGEEPQQEGVFQGPPTTLLAELQMRKQHQKQRVRNPVHAFPEGMRATLLEMDAVAETQRKQRQKQRVQLAWEEQDSHLDQNGSDDEDVPLAVLAAMQQGAKNMADLERPLGLMEIREMEDNEPLSQRQARLQGRDSLFVPQRQSVLSLSAPRMMEVQPVAPPPVIVRQSPVPPEDENEEETLGARRRRLADGHLPKARPVSSAFSTELLSQFGDLEEKETKDKPTINRNENTTPNVNGEEETLGQRRRRLQAEREAREREMSYGNLVGEPAKKPARRVSMADMLTVHQKRDPDFYVVQERRRLEEQQRVAEQEARMTFMRSQMPTSLTGPNNGRNGGFRGGVYNDGTGGLGPEGAKSSPALHTQSFNNGHAKRASMMAGGYGSPMRGPMHQPSYSSLGGFGNANAPGYNGRNTMSMYGAGGMYGAGYGAGMLQPGMPTPMTMNNPNSMDRVERWRQSVQP